MTDIPKMLKMGLIPADTSYRAVFEVSLDAPFELSDLPDIKFTPKSLTEGENTVTATVSPLRDGTILYTDFKIADEKVFVTAEAVKDNFAPQDAVIRRIGDDSGNKAERLYLPKYPGEAKGKTAETILTRGIHIPLFGKQFEAIISFDTDGKPHDIDAYVFLHDGSGILKGPADFVYFGNDTARGGAVSYLNAPDKRAVYVDFEKLPLEINRIDFVFAVYGNGDMFSKIKNCGVKISFEGSRMFLPLAENSGAIVAFEVAREESGFVLSPLVMPYKKGLDTLCRNYGLKVN
jgi:stress response protein SCP2